MDLMEYQAKELFAKHGVTTTLGTVVTTPEEARAAAEEYGFCVVKAQVKAGGRGKAGGVKLAKTPDEAFEHASNILGMEIKGLTVNRVLVTPATPPVEEYYFSFLLDRVEPAVPLHRQRRGRRGDRGGRQDQPRRRPADPDRPGHRRRRGEGPRDRRRGQVPRAGLRAGRRDDAGALEGLRRGGRDAGRGEPAGPARGRQARGARRQGLPRRQRGVPARGPRGVRDQGRDRPARGQGQGRRASTTSSSTARSGSSATARAWSCPPSTSSRTPARSTAASSRPTSSTSAAAPTRR